MEWCDGSPIPTVIANVYRTSSRMQASWLTVAFGDFGTSSLTQLSQSQAATNASELVANKSKVTPSANPR
jgi:hypothetical protein